MRHRFAWLSQARWPARCAYLGVLLLATLTPFWFDLDAGRVAQRVAGALRPGVSGVDAIDGARNAVLFAGWGAVWALTASGPLRRILASATLSGWLISVSIETLQLFSDNRTSSILDVITNTGGAFAGALVLVLLVLVARVRVGTKSYVGIPALTIAGAYGAAVGLEALIPLFRQLTVPGASGGLLGRMSAVLGAFSINPVGAVPLEDLPLFLPAGFLAVAAFAESGLGYRDALVRTIGGGAVLMAGIEIAHAPLGLPVELGALPVHAGAIALGAWTATRTLPTLTNALRGAARVRALYLSYAAVLTIWMWRPWQPELTHAAILAKLQGNWWMPLGMLGGGRFDMFSVVDVCLPFFLFLPIGALLAAWPISTAKMWRGPLPGLWLSLALETGQLFIIGRSLDVTDLLIQASGVLMGYTIIKRAGYGTYGTVTMGRAAFSRPRVRCE